MTAKFPKLTKALRAIASNCFADHSQFLDLPWWLRIAFAIIGGSCIFLAFPNFDLNFLAFIALAFQLWAIEGLKPKRAFLIGWLSGAITNVGGFYWISSLLQDFGHMPLPVAALICGALCLYQGLAYALWTFAIQKINAKSIWLTAPALFIAIEMLFPMIFPWYLANSQYNFIYAVQTADIFGVLGVSLLIVSFNILIFDISKTIVLKRRFPQQNIKFHKFGISAAIAFIAFAAIYAPIRISQIDNIQNNAPKMSIGIVEGDVGIWEKEPPEKLRNNLFIHHALSHQLDTQGVDLIVWPESSYQSGLIWGSQSKTNDELSLEIDAMFAPWFQPNAHLVYNIIDSAFGKNFHKLPAIHSSIFLALQQVAEDKNLKTLEQFYPSMVAGYPFPCSDKKPQIMKCPFVRVVPDDITYYVPSAEPMRSSRKDDLLQKIRPEDFTSPIRGFNSAVIFATLSIETTANLTQSFDAIYKLPASQRKLYNNAHLVAPNGKVLAKYHKNYLLMFGEYIPFADKFPWVYDILPEAGNLTPGSDINTMKLNGFDIGLSICYEGILPRYFNKLSKLAPNVFINITNDAWFGKTSEPKLHLALAMMRAVEHRKWLVRSTNTGISAFIDPNGRLVQHTSIYDPEILKQNVAMMPNHRTIYSYIGDLLGFLAVLWCLAICFLKQIFIKSQKK